MSDELCAHCGLPVYVMWRPRVPKKLVHRGTHVVECASGGTVAARRGDS